MRELNESEGNDDVVGDTVEETVREGARSFAGAGMVIIASVI